MASGSNGNNNDHWKDWELVVLTAGVCIAIFAIMTIAFFKLNTRPESNSPLLSDRKQVDSGAQWILSDNLIIDQFIPEINYLFEIVFATLKAVPNSYVALVLAKSLPRLFDMAAMTSAFVTVER